MLDAYLYSGFEEFFQYSQIKVEHILPNKWQNANFDDWNEETHKQYLEQIGNKILLEKKFSISCGNTFFATKQKVYEKSVFKEVQALAKREKKKWDKEDIETRNKEMYERLKVFCTR